jgi:hypothetical protein
MTQIFGDFPEDIPTSHEFLMIGFFPHSLPLKQRWRNNGLSADFVADYLTTFFPVNENEPDTFERQLQLKSAVNYIANELIDNAMKFNYEISEYPVKFGLHLLQDKLVLTSKNCVSGQVLTNFHEFINELKDSNLDDLYIKHLEKGAMEESQESQLGILTMMTDYLAIVGWKIETIQKDPEIVTLTTRVQLAV